ncbi:hypothetical protein M2322_004604 [Rhodoblastus acidophilus]|uniref:Imm32 family immunity protein n=1 Tax=Rhodoblastus acidophilus TaxID=1074 RepID=UPI002224533C|nr:hypothetical protein [Rhodoblastus acidophilus]MCW2319035.1 hypothetical protein [Rhodoblastus acidophilus]
MTQTQGPKSSDPKLAMRVDGAGLTVYANKAALLSLAERLQALAQQSPDDCYEIHTRLAFDDGLPDGQPNVSLLVDGEISEFFSRLPPDAPADAVPCGFELTFYGVADLKFFDVGCVFFSQLIVENIADRGWEGLNFQVRDFEEEWAKFYCERFDYEFVS